MLLAKEVVDVVNHHDQEQKVRQVSEYSDWNLYFVIIPKIGKRITLHEQSIDYLQSIGAGHSEF